MKIILKANFCSETNQDQQTIFQYFNIFNGFVRGLCLLKACTYMEGETGVEWTAFYIL